MDAYERKQTIDLTRTEQYILSIRLQPDGFSFYIYDPLTKGSFLYEEERFGPLTNYTEAFTNGIYSHEYLLQNYRKIYAVLVSDRFTFVPSGWTNEAGERIYYDFCYPSHTDKVYSTRLPRTGIMELFGTEPGLGSFIERTFPEARIIHHLAPLCEYFYARSRLGNTFKTFVHLQAGRLDVICFDRRGLLFANSFSFITPMDAVYYILNVWKQQRFSQENDELYLIGPKELSFQVEPILKRYIAQVLPVIFPSEMYGSSEDIRRIPFDLIVLPSCEL